MFHELKCQIMQQNTYQLKSNNILKIILQFNQLKFILDMQDWLNI